MDDNYKTIIVELAVYMDRNEHVERFISYDEVLNNEEEN
jgi:hypothetical protein